MTGDGLEERKRLYKETRNSIDGISKSVSEAYDRALLTLSSAFLGGSLAFTDSVVDMSHAVHKWMLYLAWLSLVLTILVTVGSFLFSLLTLQALRSGARKYYIEGDQNAWQVSATHQRWVLRFCVVAGVSFGAGIVLLAMFVTINAMKEKPMAQAPERVEKSIPPPTFEKPVQPSAPAQPPAAVPQAPAKPSP